MGRDASSARCVANHPRYLHQLARPVQPWQGCGWPIARLPPLSEVSVSSTSISCQLWYHICMQKTCFVIVWPDGQPVTLISNYRPITWRIAYKNPVQLSPHLMAFPCQPDQLLRSLYFPSHKTNSPLGRYHTFTCTTKLTSQRTFRYCKISLWTWTRLTCIYCYRRLSGDVS
jgi:hypothetical protein